MEPLASRLRPRSLDEFVGQRQLVGPGKPLRLAIEDESSRHHGHAGWREGGETHFRVEIVSAAFEGRNRVARQRLVYAALRQELEEGLHALALTTLSPDEDKLRP